MKICVPIYCASYGAWGVVARSFGSIDVGAVGQSFEMARTRLRERLRDRLERTHPGALPDLDRQHSLTHRRIPWVLYRDRSRSSDESLEEHGLAEPLDVMIERHADSWARLTCLQIAASRWIHLDHEVEPQTCELTPFLQGWLKRLRARETHVSAHRPIPDEVHVSHLEVSYTPVELHSLPDESRVLEPSEGTIDAIADLQPRSTLRAWASCWTEHSDDGPPQLVPTFGRYETYEDLYDLLCHEPPTPVLLIGPPRVGKTALVRHLGSDLVESRDATPEHLWALDPTGENEGTPLAPEHAGHLLEALEASDDLLYLGRLIEGLAWGEAGHHETHGARRLASMIEAREVRIVAEARPEEWRQLESEAPSLADTFEALHLHELDDRLGDHVVQRSLRRIESNEEIEYTEEALEQIASLHRRFTSHGSVVGASIDFAHRLARYTSQEPTTAWTARDVARFFGEETDLPPSLVQPDHPFDLEALRDRLADRVIGQREAIRDVTDVVGAAQADLGDRRRPFGAFIFVGPTGVGKTELAHALADEFLGDEDRLLRLDMNEYGQPHDYRRLIGAHGDEGTLTAPVRRTPFSIVLLDEIEKAHANLFDCLLPMLGDARLTDAEGRTTRCHNTMIIMTSNIGETSAESPHEDGSYREAVESTFRPEFIGRLDRIIPFRSLDREAICTLVERRVRHVGERRGMRARNLELSIDESVLDRLAELGWTPRYGARPVRRVVERQVASSLACRLSTVELAEERSYRMEAHLDDDGEIAWRIEPLETDDPTHRGDERLLELLEQATQLRRRLRDIMQSRAFETRVEELERHERAQQSEGFWQREEAAERAQRAEYLREMLEPAREMVEELEAIESLAREAFHSRSDELTEEIASQLDDYRPRVDSLLITLLRQQFEQPDEITLLFPAEEARSEWRDRLLEWYRGLARRRDWSCQLWQGIPPGERDRSIGLEETFEQGELWRPQRNPHGRALALCYRGPAVRAFLRGESGRHRLVTRGGTEVTEVHVVEDGESWPHPDHFQFSDPLRQTARTWNKREECIEMPETEPIPWTPEYPWEALADVLASRARAHLDRSDSDETGER